MGLFAKKVMFSDVTGEVTLDGQPIKGVEVIQFYQWAWNDKKVEYKTITDDQGMFSFPARKIFGGLANILPHEPVISQRITIKYNDKDYVLWQHSKHNYEMNGELKGNKLILELKL